MVELVILQPESQSAAPSDESQAPGRCSRCGAELPPEAERCPSCGCWAAANRGGLKHGGRSIRVKGALLREQAETLARLADRRYAIEQDLGGADALSEISRDLLARYVETSVVAEFLAGVLVGSGPLTPRGRTRSALSAYLQVIDRQHRLAGGLGLERRAKRVPSLAEVMADNGD